jgi:hypothetical protein
MIDLEYVLNTNKGYMKMRKEDHLQILDDIIIGTLQTYDPQRYEDSDFAASIGMDIMTNVYLLSDEDIDAIFDLYTDSIITYASEHLPNILYSKINVHSRNGVAKLHIYT